MVSTSAWLLLAVATGASPQPAGFSVEALATALKIAASDLDATTGSCLSRDPLPVMPGEYKDSGAMSELFSASVGKASAADFKSWRIDRTRAALKQARLVNRFGDPSRTPTAKTCTIVLRIEIPRASHDALALRVITSAKGAGSRERAYLFRYEKGALIVAAQTPEHIVVN